MKNSSKLPKSNLTNILLSLGLFLLTILLRIPTIYKPLDLNYENLLAFLGREAFFGGGFYSTPWSMKPPGGSIFYGFTYFLFGANNLAIGSRILLAFLSASATVIIFKLGNKVFGRWAGFFSALFFTLFFSREDVFTGTVCYAEMLVPLFSVLGYYLFFVAKEKNNKLILFFSGFSLGISLLIKQSAIFDALPLILFAFFEEIISLKNKDFKGIKEVVFYLVPLVLGFALPLTIFVFYFILIDKFNLFWDWAVLKPMLYSKFREKHPGPYIAHVFDKTIPICIFAFLAVLVTIYKRDLKRILFIVWLAFTTLTFVTSGKFWNYYFIEMFLALSILAGIFVSDIVSLKKKWFSLFCITGILLVLFNYNKVTYLALFRRYYSFLTKKVSKEEYIYSFSDIQWQERYEAANLFKKISKQKDTLFVMENTQGVYVLADKEPIYKEFIWNQQFFENKSIGFTFLNKFQTYEGNWKKLIDNLMSNPPDFIILVPDPLNELSMNLKTIPQFYSFVFSNYEYINNFNDVWIFKKKSGAITLPSGLVMNPEFVKKYFIITTNPSGQTFIEPLFSVSEPIPTSFSELTNFSYKNVPVKLLYFGIDGSDIVGYMNEGPSGNQDIHLKASGILKPIKAVRVKKDNINWSYPANGANPIVKVVKIDDIINLYFEPSSDPEGNYEVTIIFEDNSVGTI